MGKLRVYCLKTLNKLSIYPLGNTPSAPSVRARCALNKFTFEDGMYATYVLLALPKSYQAVKDSFFATNNLTTIKSADVQACIIETEIRRKAESSASANTLLSKQQGSGHKPKRQPNTDDACKYCVLRSDSEGIRTLPGMEGRRVGSVSGR